MLINGKNINMRTDEVDDADFIYRIRQNQSKTKYLSKVTGTIQDQRDWIANYKCREQEKDEFYFIIESNKVKSSAL